MVAINLKIVLEYAGLATGVLAVLFVVGYPLRRVLDEKAGRLAAIPAPLIGIAMFQVTTWYWYKSGGRGAALPAGTLVVVGIGATAFRVWLDRRRRRLADLGRIRLSAAAAALAAVIVLVNFGALFNLSFVTTASDGNNDAAAYAVIGQHLAHHGFNDAGNIVGMNIGVRSGMDDFGSTTLLASLSSVLHTPVWKLTMTVMFVFLGLMLYSIALLLGELLGGRGSIAIVGAAASCCTVLFIYIVGQYFLGQVMAMSAAPVLAVIALRTADRSVRDWRHTVRLATTTTFVLLVMMSHYFHMAVLAPPLIVPPALLAASGSLRFRALLQRLSGAVITMGLGAVVAVAVVPQWVASGYQQTKTVASVKAGWPLATFWPVELLGFFRQLTPRTSAGRWGWSLVIVVVLAGSLATMRHREARLVRYASGLIVLTGASYGILIATSGGGSYRQWKWITFFQPLLVSLVVVVVAQAAVHVIRARQPQVPTAVTLGLVSAYALAVSTNVGHEPNTAMRGRQPPIFATLALADLGRSPSLQGLTDVNLRLSPYWETMWGAYFLDHSRVHLQSLSYFPVTPADARSTVLPTIPGVSLPGAHPLNEDYQVAPTPTGATSNSPDGLMADILSLGVLDQDADRPTTLRLEIRNSGATTWLPSGTPLGSVNIGAHLANVHGTVLAYDWFHRPIIDSVPEGIPLPPGSKISMDLVLPALPSGDYLAQLGLVSERVRWFGPIVSIPLHVR